MCTLEWETLYRSCWQLSNSELEKLSLWLRSNKLSLNAQKNLLHYISQR